MRAARTRLSTLPIVLLAAGLVAYSVPVAAADFTVNRTTDAGDPSPGDGICDVDSVASGQQCTLRAAVQTANASPDTDTIRFGFGGVAAKTINVPTSLPQIVEPVVIDGYSAANTRANSRRSGSNAKLRIVLKGPGSGAVDGLKVYAPSTIKGLVFQRFRDGIYLGPGGEGTLIAGNFIGSNPAGTSAAQIRGYGVHVDCDSAVAIGGGSRAARNLIASSRHAGILLCETVDGTTIRGNLIGVGANARMDLGNRGPGIVGYGSHDVTVGGDSKAAQNVIAHNAAGIVLQENGTHQARGVRILGNSFFRNSGLGIDLDFDQVTPNDPPGDADNGSNSLQNFPVLTEVKNKNGKTRVKGRMWGEASSTYQVRFFLDGYSEREGSKFLKVISVTTGGDGKVSFNTSVPKQAKGRRITATATNVTVSPAETSEFAASKKIQ